MEINWISTSIIAIILSGTSGLCFWGFRYTVSQVKTDQKKDKEEIIGKICENKEAAKVLVKELEKRVAQDEDEMMSEEKHELICENRELKVNAHISAEMTQLKDEVFSEFRELKVLVKNGNGKK